MQFAYYESYLVVDFLIDRFGMESVKDILKDLGEGVEINKAIADHTVAMDDLETDFAGFARDRARKLGPSLDWKKPEADKSDKLEGTQRIRRPLAGGPDVITNVTATAEIDTNLSESTNYFVLMRGAQKLLRDKKWQEAKAPLEKLIKACPDQTGPENAYILLAAAHRRLRFRCALFKPLK